MATVFIVVGISLFFQFFFWPLFHGDVLESKPAVKEIKSAVKKVELSKVSQFILKEYEKIPAEHKPESVLEVLEQLDKKYSLDNAYNHFAYSGYAGIYLFDMDCRCRYGMHDSKTGCTRFPEYQELYNEIVGLKEDALNKERAFLASSMDSDAVLELMQRLRDEREVAVDTTKMLKGME